MSKVSLHLRDWSAPTHPVYIKDPATSLSMDGSALASEIDKTKLLSRKILARNYRIEMLILKYNQSWPLQDIQCCMIIVPQQRRYPLGPLFWKPQDSSCGITLPSIAWPWKILARAKKSYLPTMFNYLKKKKQQPTKLLDNYNLCKESPQQRLEIRHRELQSQVAMCFSETHIHSHNCFDIVCWVCFIKTKP